jgi:hypothetical protein
MAGYRSYKHHVTRRGVRRRTHKRNMGSLGMDFSVAQRGITASMSAVKSVGMVALVAAGGAIATDYIFRDLLKGKTAGTDIMGFANGSTEQNIAKAVTGVAGGLIIGRFLKKPQLGAAFAIGAVALAVYNILNKTLKITTVKGLGYIATERQKAFYPRPMAALGAQRAEDAMSFKPMPVPQAAFGAY